MNARSHALYQYYKVYNLRTPKAVVAKETVKQNLYGEPTIFQEVASEIEEYDQKLYECFSLQGKSDSNSVITKLNTIGLPMFRTKFHVKKDEIKTSRLYITSRGIYDCKVNGREITKRKLSPGLTQYDARMNYQTYVLNDVLEDGDNAIGITLSSGWW